LCMCTSVPPLSVCLTVCVCVCACVRVCVCVSLWTDVCGSPSQLQIYPPPLCLSRSPPPFIVKLYTPKPPNRSPETVLPEGRAEREILIFPSPLSARDG